MKALSATALALSSLFATGGPGQANEQTIVVSAPPTVRQWSRNVSRDLDNNLRFPSSYGLSSARGVVSIGFVSGENGTPAAVTLLSSSSYRQFDRAALIAVNKLTTLRPMPQQFGNNQKFRANIFFANNEKDMIRQIKDYERSARMNPIAASREGIVSLTVGAPTAE